MLSCLNKKTAALTAVAVFFIAIDRLLKFLAANNFFQSPLPIISDILKLNLSRNYNVAFSLPLHGIWLITAIASILLVLIFFFLRSCRQGNYVKAFCFLLVILGGASNLCDRLQFGYVIDYLDLKYFTVFNLADVMIVAGMAGLLCFLRGLDVRKEM